MLHISHWLKYATFRHGLNSNECLLSSLLFCVCLCVCMCEHVCTTGRCKASMSGPVRRGEHGQVCRIQEGRLNTWPLLTKLFVHAHTHIHTHAQIHTNAYTLVPSGSPLLTDASCPAVQPTHTNTHTHCFPGTRTGWPRGQVEGQPHPLVLLWCFC